MTNRCLFMDNSLKGVGRFMHIFLILVSVNFCLCLINFFKWMMSHVCGVAAKTFTLKIYLMWQMWRDKKFLSFISIKMEQKSPPNILVTRNPNWSQKSGMETSCLKDRYQHQKYALPKVGCIILLYDKIEGFVVFSSCWFVYYLRKILLGKEVLILSGKT